MPQYFGQLPTTEQTWTTIGKVQSIQHRDRGIYFQCSNSCIAISILAPNLIRVRMSPTGKFIPRRSWAVTLDDEDWAITPFELKETDAVVEITTAQIKIHIHRQDCHITCFDQANRPFAQDADMGSGWRMGAVAGWKKLKLMNTSMVSANGLDY